jgi:hypothetical protein
MRFDCLITTGLKTIDPESMVLMSQKTKLPMAALSVLPHW